MPHLKVHTAQNVLLEYAVGNIGQRILSGVLDLLFCFIYLWAAIQIFSSLSDFAPFSSNSEFLRFFLISLPVILYLPVIEYFWNGKTLGKAILKLQVIRIDGSAPSLGDIILRWLVRIVDVKLGFLLLFFAPQSPSSEVEEIFMIWVFILMVVPLPVVGIISMANSPIGQRLGDRVANTVVIKTKQIFSLKDTLLKATEENYEPRYLNVLKLSDKDIYVIKSTIEQAEKTHDYKNALTLAEKARDILEIKDKEKPFILLKTLLKDYNHLARQRDGKS